MIVVHNFWPNFSASAFPHFGFVQAILLFMTFGRHGWELGVGSWERERSLRFVRVHVYRSRYLPIRVVWHSIVLHYGTHMGSWYDWLSTGAGVGIWDWDIGIGIGIGIAI